MDFNPETFEFYNDFHRPETDSEFIYERVMRLDKENFEKLPENIRDVFWEGKLNGETYGHKFKTESRFYEMYLYDEYEAACDLGVCNKLEEIEDTYQFHEWLKSKIEINPIHVLLLQPDDPIEVEGIVIKEINEENFFVIRNMFNLGEEKSKSDFSVHSILSS